MVRCPCCDGSNLTASPAHLAPFVAERTGAKQDCHTMTCNSCGFMFCDTRFTDKQMTALYRDYRGPEYVKQRERHEPGYKTRNDGLLKPCRWLSQIEEFIGKHITLPVKILDWGGDTGTNSPFAGNRELHIYDISRKPVIKGALKVSHPCSYYDLVVCASVLEHLPDPAKTVNQIARLEPGLVYFDVPAETKKREWWHEHINVFNLDPLTVLLQRCGLELVDQKYLTNPSMLMVVCK